MNLKSISNVFFGFIDYRGVKDVYILTCDKNPDRTYVGLTNNLPRRLREHNAGKSCHTKEQRPWSLETYIAFSDEEKAKEFERYLKRGGGWRFAKRRLLGKGEGK